MSQPLLLFIVAFSLKKKSILLHYVQHMKEVTENFVEYFDEV